MSCNSKKKIDYSFKSYVLGLKYNNQLLVDVMRKLSLSLNFPDNCFSLSKKVAEEIYNDILEKFDFKVIREVQKINQQFYQRTKRLKDKIENLITKNDCLFLTLTFNDEFLSTTKSSYRKQCIRRFLKQFNADYIANIDFGKKNGREHYHAIISVDFIDNKLYKYGAINFKHILKTSDTIKLAKYISKLTNHAVKESTKRNVIIYSR